MPVRRTFKKNTGPSVASGTGKQTCPCHPDRRSVDLAARCSLVLVASSVRADMPEQGSICT